MIRRKRSVVGAPPVAGTFSCHNSTIARLSGHAWRFAYIRIVVSVHAPSPANKYSYGDGPAFRPPLDSGSSAVRTWRPTVTVCAYGGPLSATITWTCILLMGAAPLRQLE